MVQNPKSEMNFLDLVRNEMTRLSADSHTARVIFIAQKLEGFLEDLIRLRMPNLSNTLAEKLFRGYGPFSSFTAKIDTAFAMNLIDHSIKLDLHVIRQIRNVFAHPKGAKFVDFHSDNPQIEVLFGKFDDYSPDADKNMFIARKFQSILERMQPHMRQAYAAKAFLGFKKPPPLPGKSA